MRSGFVHVSDGLFMYTAQEGDYWTLSTSTTLYTGNADFGAFFLFFRQNEVQSSHDATVRWAGFPLRCLARTILTVYNT